MLNKRTKKKISLLIIENEKMKSANSWSLKIQFSLLFLSNTIVHNYHHNYHCHSRPPPSLQFSTLQPPLATMTTYVTTRYHCHVHYIANVLLPKSLPKGPKLFGNALFIKHVFPLKNCL